MRSEDQVRRIDLCSFSLTGEQWPFADTYCGAIDAHWSRRSADNTAMFNGVIHLLTDLEIADGTCFARFLRTDFKSYLYWRELGFPEAGVRDGFGSALIRSCEGHVILGRQQAGNLNAGQVYLPGGFIDQRDVRADRAIDIEASILREVGEETGLADGDLERQAGFYVTLAGPLVSVAAEFRSHLTADELCARIMEHIRTQVQPELAEAVVVCSAADLAAITMPKYSHVLLSHLLGTTRP